MVHRLLRGRQVARPTIVLFSFAVLSATWLAVPAQASTHEILSHDERRVEVAVRFPQPTYTRSIGPDGAWSEVRVAGTPWRPRTGRASLPEYTLLVAVPAGTAPELDLLFLEESTRGADAGPSIADVHPDTGRQILRASRDDEPSLATIPAAARIEWLGVARHLRLARLVFQPVRYDANGQRWLETRAARVRVRFERSFADEENPPRDADDHDLRIATGVINPSAVPSATVLSGVSGRVTGRASSDSIPAPEPSVMTPVRILVRTDGLYEITRTDLVNAGADPTGINPNTFVVTHRGVEQRIEVSGAADGAFDSSDRLRFWGRGLTGEETPDNVYRLTGGVRSGLRVSTVAGAPAGTAPVPVHFRDESLQEIDALYWGGLPDDAASAWGWDKLNIATPGQNVFVDRTIDLTNVSTQAVTGRLEVKLQSRRETPGPSPNHHARIYFNGNLVDDETWTGLIGPVLSGNVPQSWIHNGANTVRIESTADLGLSTQEEWTDWIRLIYFKRFVAETNYLLFTGEGAPRSKFEVTNFVASNVVVYDVTEDGNMKKVSGVQMRQDGATWTAVFSNPSGAPPSKYAVLRSGSGKKPYAFQKDVASDLRAQASTGADLLIVSYDGFYDAVERLADHRRDQGLRVVTARLSDVYDEFGGGIAEVQGIRNFVQWAFEQYAAPAPTYLLLVGDGTYDPENNLGEGDNDVPAAFFRAPNFGFAPTDTWYAAVNGDDAIPDLAAGRISVRTVADLNVALDNLIAYEDAPPVAALNAGTLYSADDDDPLFESILDDLVTSFQPPGMAARRVYLDDYPQTTAGVDSATADLKANVDAGSLLTTYMGHGGRTLWASESVWNTGDVSSLAATSRLTFGLALNCVNGYFTNLDAEPYALGEQWNRYAGRGAVGNWAPSATGTIPNYDALSNVFFRHVFDLKQPRWGLAAWRALLDAYLLDGVPEQYLKQMVYFGDPAALIPLDWDHDTRLDRDEIAFGMGPEDLDSDDDGVTDQTETSWDQDRDGDGRVNAADYDADDDGLPDGLERGVTSPSSGTDTTQGHYTADAHPTSTTDPLLADTDGGGAPDGAEDRNANGRLDSGEKNPTLASDDPACSQSIPPAVANLKLAKSGSDLKLTWSSQSGRDPCILYRVYVATDAGVPENASDFVYTATVTQASWFHRGAKDDGHQYHYLVSAFSLAKGEGPLGFGGR